MHIPTTDTEFYDCFETVFSAIRLELPKLKRSPGRLSEWAYPVAGGSLSFAFVTSSRAASLWPQMPGEFRAVMTWSVDGRRAVGGDVSLFQYTSDRDTADYAAIQRRALEKFLLHPGNAKRRDLFVYATDPVWLPGATDEEWCYYFDAEDIYFWAEWYRRVLPQWLDSFAQAPETRYGWALRAMRPRRASVVSS